METRLNEADQYLLDAIRGGDAGAWTQLVQRYQGRLLAFARSRVPQSADAEDLVQDAFINFIKGLDAFRGQASLETYLFTILRRKIIDTYRSAAAKKVGLIQDMVAGGSNGEEEKVGDPFGRFCADAPSPSTYARNEEAHQAQADALAGAITDHVNQLKQSLKFRDLKIIELIFYCKLANKDIAALLDLTENNIALIKHRCVKLLRDKIMRQNDGSEAELSEQLDQTVAALWEQQRLSCPKRSTIGQYTLGSLEDDWADYVDFHLNRLGCHFCRANLNDLDDQREASEQNVLQQRILESSVGFLCK